MATTTITAYVYARDFLTESGLQAQLESSGKIQIQQCPGMADLAVVAWPELDETLANKANQIADSGCGRVLLIIGRLDDRWLPWFLTIDAQGLLRSGDLARGDLAEAVVAVHKGGVALPPDLTSQLLDSVNRNSVQMSTQSPIPRRLSERELLVLRLLAEGFDTLQIAEELHYSERTIKSIVHQVVRRYGLRNRSHAVAFALRNQLI